MPPTRKAFLLRLQPAVHDRLRRWAEDDLRSLNGQIEFLLIDALKRAGRAPARSEASEEGSAPDGRKET